MIGQWETADQGGNAVCLKRFDHFRDSLRNVIFKIRNFANRFYFEYDFCPAPNISDKPTEMKPYQNL
jgi:hypothetical protein